MMEHRAYRITGAVQGVGFRWWTRNLADRNDLRGTVRNASDGSVEVVVVGEARVLDDFETQLRVGPPSARVTDVQRREPVGEPPTAGFEIIR